MRIVNLKLFKYSYNTHIFLKCKEISVLSISEKVKNVRQNTQII